MTVDIPKCQFNPCNYYKQCRIVVHSLFCCLFAAQVLDPTKRLGCEMMGGYGPLKDHVFLDGTHIYIFIVCYDFMHYSLVFACVRYTISHYCIIIIVC